MDDVFARLRGSISDGWSGDAPAASASTALEAADEGQRLRLERDSLAAQLATACEGLKDMFALLDEGWLVRDISKDHEPGFAMRQLLFVRRLQKAHELVSRDSSFRTGDDEKQ